MDIEPVAFGSHHWSYQSFVNELSNSMGYYFAAYDKSSNQLLGYSGFWLVNGQEEAHVTTLAVHPEHRRQYIGERLLINDIVEARKVGARWLTLEVRMSNDTAQKLYYKYGFKNLGVRKHYYQDNDEDALVLWTENIESPEFVEMLHERVLYLKSRGEFSDLESAESFPEIPSNGKSVETGKLSRRSAQQTVSRSSFKGADEC
ncbi:MAG: ribosomal protein S18-alanine N-acetyltransferase [Cyanobacteria bacterium SZAS-4]|nr:ribosomal protein S18-alanine N-acetyltransferase [Cyanobacteria bacterium SZAS-4]